MLLDAIHRRPLAALTLGATLLTVALALPVLVHPHERILGNEIVGRHPDAYMAMRDFDAPRIHPKVQPGVDWIGALVALTTSSVAAFNFVVLMSFPLTAVATYLLARHIDIPPPWAAFAGLVYAFSPFHVAHAAYHVSIVQMQWLPLFFLVLWRSIDAWSWARGTLLLATVGFLFLSNYYAGYFAAVLAPFAMLGYWWCAPCTQTRPTAGLIRTSSLLGACAVIGGLWSAWIFARLDLSIAALRVPRSDLFLYGARWWSYLVPPIDHPVLGDLASRLWSDRPIGDGLVEQQLSLGLVVPLLALFSVLSAGPEAAGTRARSVPCLCLVGVAAFVFSLAPVGEDGTALGLPALALYEIAPFFRAFARFGAFFQLMAVLLAAIALHRLSRKRSAASGAIAFGMVAVIAFENTPLPPWRWHDVLPTAAHRALASRSGEWHALDCISYRQGYREFALTELLPRPLRFLAAQVEDCGEPHIAAKLAAKGLTHAIVRFDSPDAAAFAADRAPPDGLALERFDDSLLLSVDAATPQLYLKTLSGFFWREYADGQTFRWLSEKGALVVENTTDETLEAVMTLQIQSFHTPRRLAVLIGTTERTLEIATAPEIFDLGPVRFPPGETRLRLTPEPGAARPAQVTGGNDERRLSIALWDWDFEIRP